ncbi:Appr-1-p processing protein [Thermosipho melanesiensis]|uniref:Appr-1-p processing domain protein n=2 Tax=Thermosipho melanesiensis TaxID=46541 RepID=A6LJC9_THEM4|nr:macro domain-containing protein [Thermosipho melanesiensis]ABR30030.1 Appr-1-p processing domain protein [Thermosipho melanesiensis BI429]APT73231.1 Appr-1-p processing protein [Thermosipho melanesiensis]OOC38624.1 Appr-1-p processing protein [Thermosipho melanesiensis]OOC40428.1 Appr-1-p processing protein [Thermosipho melanesiensis]OOC40693.1 Appr-1-p processing protein [Thermosipho melanesiensis]
MEIKINNVTVRLINDDITEQHVDAIVNAANSSLKHGGGVAGAILKKGGYIIQEESDEYVQKHGPVPTGGVTVTTAGNLNAKYIIHAVGPVWRGGENNEEEKLRSAIWNSLKTACKLNIKTIAFPAISSGIFGFPVDRCAKIFKEVISKFTSKERCLDEIRIVNIDSYVHEVFVKEFSCD